LLQKFEQGNYNIVIKVAGGAPGRIEQSYQRHQGETAWREIIRRKITNLYSWIK